MGELVRRLVAADAEDNRHEDGGAGHSEHAPVADLSARRSSDIRACLGKLRLNFSEVALQHAPACVCGGCNGLQSRETSRDITLQPVPLNGDVAFHLRDLGRRNALGRVEAKGLLMGAAPGEQLFRCRRPKAGNGNDAALNDVARRVDAVC